MHMRTQPGIHMHMRTQPGQRRPSATEHPRAPPPLTQNAKHKTHKTNKAHAALASLSRKVVASSRAPARPRYLRTMASLCAASRPSR
jgi:hypothetical protein